jgi:hypothetical protein
VLSQFKKVAVFSLVTILLILMMLLTLFIVYPASPSGAEKDQKPFYVGVTFCGNTTAEAKHLIDKVKNYTNLFVLQSGPLQRNNTAMDEIGDYAIACGLHFSVYSGVDAAFQSDEWINASERRWGSQFLGIYYNDEPGGKMLDNYLQVSQYGADEQITKLGSGGIDVSFGNGTQITFNPDGTVRMSLNEGDSQNGTLVINSPEGIVTLPNVPHPKDGDSVNYPNGTSIRWFPLQESSIVTYYPNGTMEIWKQTEDALFTIENGSSLIAQVEPYSSVLAKSPIKNFDEAAQRFVSNNRASLEWLNNQSVTVFTSDYALYWWDYQSGYDVVLAEFGWNNTIDQEIALTRGAATLQNKSWGAIITWTYTQPPYSTNGTEMYSQMRTAYEAGAEYVIVFNYPTMDGNQYGILQDEHFQALERFWSEVVQNAKVDNEEFKAEAALVLPRNYGWGMRNPNDIIWGIWNTNSTSEQIWSQLQNKLLEYGSRLDIVYDDPSYPVAGRYSNIYYWNQTS